MTPRLVLIEWVDSNGSGGWEATKDALRAADENELRCETAGWLVADTARYVVIASSRTVGREESDQVCATMQIPRCAITNIRVLKSNGRLV